MLNKKQKTALLCPTIEHLKYNQALHQITIFPISTINKITKINFLTRYSMILKNIFTNALISTKNALYL